MIYFIFLFNAVFHPYAMEKGLWLRDFFFMLQTFGYMY